MRVEMGKNITLKKLAPVYAPDLHLHSQGFSSLRISSSELYTPSLAPRIPIASEFPSELTRFLVNVLSESLSHSEIFHKFVWIRPFAGSLRVDQLPTYMSNRPPPNSLFTN